LYGLLWSHSNLNKSTHESLGESFGFANARGLAQLSRIIANGHPICAVSSDKDPNRPMYNKFSQLSMPIRFISGEKNYCFDPKSTAASIVVAKQVQPLSDRVVIPAYGHIDVFMGKDAVRDAYPHFETFLSLHQNFVHKQEELDALDKKHFAFAKKSCCVVL